MMYFFVTEKFCFHELENMAYKEYIDLIEEIPSLNESVYSDEEDEEIIVTPIQELETEMENPRLPLEADESSDSDIPLTRLITQDTFVWSKTMPTFQNSTFTQSTGPINIPDDTESHIEYFYLLFPDELMEHIVFQTNLYATQSQKPHIPTNIKEMKIFLAINILMGIKKLPSYRDYWSARSELRDSYISQIMSWHRFDFILGNFHLNDNSVQPKRGEPHYDKLYKVRPFINIISKTFSEHYKVSKGGHM